MSVSMQAGLEKILRLVEEQAEDEGLWFIAAGAPEDYVQKALRRLHLLVESVCEEVL